MSDAREAPTPRLYRYVGTADILRHTRGQPGGIPIASPADLDAWCAAAAPHRAPADRSSSPQAAGLEPTW